MCTFALFVILSYKYSIWIFYYLSYALVLRFTILFRSLAITNYDVHPCDDHTRTCCSIRVTVTKEVIILLCVLHVGVRVYFPLPKGFAFSSKVILGTNPLSPSTVYSTFMRRPSGRRTLYPPMTLP